MRLSSMTVFWNNRVTPQGATLDREKICACQSAITRRQTTQSPSSSDTKSSTMSPSLQTNSQLPSAETPDCDTFHMYPVVHSDFQGTPDGDQLSHDVVIVPHVSTGIKFIPSRDIHITAVRLRAALAKGTRA